MMENEERKKRNRIRKLDSIVYVWNSIYFRLLYWIKI